MYIQINIKVPDEAATMTMYGNFYGKRPDGEMSIVWHEELNDAVCNASQNCLGHIKGQFKLESTEFIPFTSNKS